MEKNEITITASKKITAANKTYRVEYLNEKLDVNLEWLRANACQLNTLSGFSYFKEENKEKEIIGVSAAERKKTGELVLTELFIDGDDWAIFKDNGSVVIVKFMVFGTPEIIGRGFRSREEAFKYFSEKL